MTKAELDFYEGVPRILRQMNEELKALNAKTGTVAKPIEPKVAEDLNIVVGLDRALMILKRSRGVLPGYQSDDGTYETDHAIRCVEYLHNEFSKAFPEL